jgi:EmrB/QacA subfamily drug resistance transporter
MTSSEASQQFTHRERLAVIAGLMLGMFLAALDQNIVAATLPRIAADLHGARGISWIVSIYLLTSTPATLIYGKLSDLHGRRVMFQTAIVVFTLTSVLCAVAASMGQLIAFRALQGLGGGGLIAVAHATIADIVSPRERGRYQGYFVSVFAAANVLGPALGSLFAAYLTWRWAFWINIPLGTAALAISQVTLKRLAVKGHRSEIDYWGALLIVASVGSILLATTMISRDANWLSPRIVALGATGTGLFILYLIRERRAAEPILPPFLFRKPVFVMANAVTTLISASMVGMIVFIPIFMQQVHHLRAFGSGLMLLALSGAATLAAFAGGRLVAAIGRYKLVTIAGLAINVLGMFLMSTTTNTTPLALTAAYVMLSGLGGAVMPVMLVAVQNVLDAADHGAGTASTNFFRSVGGSFGAAIFGSVLIRQVTAHIDAVPSHQRLGADLGYALLNDGGRAVGATPAELRDAVLLSMSAAFGDMFRVGAAISLIALAIALFMPDVPLRKENSKSCSR